MLWQMGKGVGTGKGNGGTGPSVKWARPGSMEGWRSQTWGADKVHLLLWPRGGYLAF